MPMVNSLKELRKAAGYGRGVVAEKLHICPETVTNWENGKSRVQMRFRPKLAEMYRVSMADIENIVNGGACAMPESDMVDVVRCRNCVCYLDESQFCRNVFLHKSPMGYCDFARKRGEDDGTGI